MVLTLPNVPRELDEALRQRAQSEGKSVDQVAVEAIRTGLGISAESTKKRDLSEFVGSWISDPEVDAALADQDRIDQGLWK
jgi:plasmid stability protein